MSENNERYASEQLAFTGFTVEDYGVAEEIRPDLMGAKSNMLTFKSDVQRCARAARATAYRMRIGRREVIVWTKSLNDLETRIENIVGSKVVMLGRVEEKSETKSQGDDYWQARRKNLDAAEDERNRKLAAETPPTHDCSRRREILEAREKIGGAA